MTLPEHSTERRLARLERELDDMATRKAARERGAAAVTPIRACLWICTLIEDMGATTAGQASASLIDIDETDTEQSVTVLDPLGMASWMASGDQAYCLEQLAQAGGRRFVGIDARPAQKKPKYRFRLSAALAQSDATGSADIISQYGYGVDHDDTETITVVNHPHSGTDDMFYGDSGDYGTASYDPDNDNWPIDIMECP